MSLRPDITPYRSPEMYAELCISSLAPDYHIPTIRAAFPAGRATVKCSSYEILVMRKTHRSSRFPRELNRETAFIEPELLQQPEQEVINRTRIYK